MTYKIKIIVLENCNYSKKALQLLKDNNINHDSIYIDNINKDKYKTNNISTYPQIYLTKQNSIGNLLLGGYNELENVIKLFKNTNNLHENKQIFMNKNINWSNKATLRLIELINQNNTG